MKIVSVVLGSYNRLGFLRIAIESIRQELERCACDAEIIVVDGGSTDGSLGWLTQQKDILTIVQHNRGAFRGQPLKRRSWGYFMNLGFKCAQGKYICMLSDDCLVVPGAIGNGISLFEEKLAGGEKVGAVAFYWRNWPEQSEYQVGLTLGNRMYVNHGLYLNKALSAVGYIDEKSYIFYHADSDVCLKMFASGYNCIASDNSYIEHYIHANENIRMSNLENQDTDLANFIDKWREYYPDVNDEKYGGWIRKVYKDNNCVAKRFCSFSVRLARIRAWLKSPL